MRQLPSAGAMQQFPEIMHKDTVLLCDILKLCMRTLCLCALVRSQPDMLLL